MSEYTSFMESYAFELSQNYDDLDEDAYREKLIEIMHSFREPNEALDHFLVSKAYDGSLTDEKQKKEFIKKHLREAGIEAPSNRNRWFDKKIGGVPAVELCFAFGLNLQESQEFFQKVCLERGLDCHNIKEAIYYYCLKNGLGYAKAKEIMAKLEKRGVLPEPERKDIDVSGDILYTASIMEALDRISSEDELIAFFEKNVEHFAYHNATAWRTIERIWEEITAAAGLANQEEERFPRAEDPVSSDKKDKPVKVFRSTWEIYKQILDLNDNQVRKMGGDRTIQPILKDNPVIHRLAAKEFPNRQNIEHIISGKTKSSEGIRKTLILLLFYKFWVKSALVHNSYDAKAGEGKRVLSQIDQHLIENGYPTLYYGNPYDWIFLYTAQTEAPLEIFRAFIGEVYLYKEEELQW